MSGPGGSSIPPPPPGNAGTAAWYGLQRERERNAALERKMADLEAKMLLEFGKIGGDLRTLKLRARRSGHDLEEFKEWKDTSEIRDLKDEIAEAKRLLAQQAKDKKERDKRIWALISAIVLVVVTAVVRELTREAPRHREEPPAAPAGTKP